MLSYPSVLHIFNAIELINVSPFGKRRCKYKDFFLNQSTFCRFFIERVAKMVFI